MWRCEDVVRCRSADVKVWRCRSADVKVWRCSITAAFLRRTLRRRSREQHVLGVLSLGFLSNNCHELVKFWGQHLPTNLKLDIFLRCATAQDRAGRNARLLKARAATAAASNLWQWSKLPNCNQNRWWICEFLWVVNDSSTADDQNWRHQF